MKDDSFTEDPDELMDETGEDVVAILKRMQQQLTFLERKLDMLISQSKERPMGGAPSHDRPFRKGPYSKPSRSFERSDRYGSQDRERGTRDRDSSHSHYYERRGAPKKRTAAPRKKPFAFPRKDKD